MLYVIVDEMIPETMDSRGSTYAHMAGLTVMMILDALMVGGAPSIRVFHNLNVEADGTESVVT